MVEFLGTEGYFWIIILGLYVLIAFKHESRNWRYHLSFFVCALAVYLWFTGRITQFGAWAIVHKVEIGQVISILFFAAIFISIIAFIIKYWEAISSLLSECWKAIIKSAIVIYVVNQIKFILYAIWAFLNTSFGFCFSIAYSLSLAVIKLDPEMVQNIYQMPLYILYGAMSYAVASMLAAIYNRVRPNRQYHSMAYYNSDPYVILFSGNVNGPSKIEWKFYFPNGDLYGTKSLAIRTGKRHCWCPIKISGTNESDINGKWHVDIFRNGKKIGTEIFVLLKEKKDIDEPGSNVTIVKIRHLALRNH
jgi:hypothetical protein